MDILTEEQVRDILRARCEVDRQSSVADDLGISPSVVSLILSGERGVSAEVGRSLGYEKRVVFVPAERAAEGLRFTGASSTSPDVAAPAHGA